MADSVGIGKTGQKVDDSSSRTITAGNTDFFRNLPDLSSLSKLGSEDPNERLKVCIATPDYLYLIKNGGIGTSFHHTACILAENNFDVTVMFCNLTDHLSSDEIEDARSKLADVSINLELLFESHIGFNDFEQMYPNDIISVSSYTAFQKLKSSDYDLILFPDWRGLGYYSLMAKKQGLAFQETAIWVQTHSTCLWHALSNEQPSFSEFDTKVFHMERKSVSMADVVVGPSRYLLEWKLEHGFEFPEATCVQPYLLTGLLGEHPERRKKAKDIKEIVFFGRLEKRKGLHIFLNAIKRLVRDVDLGDGLGDVTVTFLGKVTEIDGENSYDYIDKHLRGLNLKTKIITSLGSVEATEYLKAPGRMAVMPSVADNSPLTILECIHNKIPFIAAATGGIPEIISQKDHKHAIFNLSSKALAERLDDILKNGLSTSFPAIHQSENIPQWLQGIRTSVFNERSKNRPSAEAEVTPLVTVCITHFNRPHYLDITLEGLQKQTYTNFEVVIVDDGSTTDAAKRYLQSLETRELPFALKILRQKNQFVGAARNRAMSEANGKYVVFMDDDNYSHSEQLETFVSAATFGDYDALTCCAIAFEESEDPRNLSSFLHVYVPLGCGLAPNLYGNQYGDANGIYKLDFVKSLGGYTEDENLSWEDYELLSKIEISGGSIGVIPEPLMYLRYTVGSVSRRGSQLANHYRALRPALGSLPWNTFGDAILVSLSGSFGYHAQVHRSPEDQPTETAKHLSITSEYSGTSLRLLTRRMVEKGLEKDVFPALAEHYYASSHFSFALLEAFFFGVKSDMSLPQILSALELDEEAKSSFLQLAEAYTEYSAEEFKDFLIERHSTIENSADGQILLAQLSLYSGDVYEALVRASKAFDEVEFGYLRRNADIKKHVANLPRQGLLNKEPLRSGIHHWLVHGRHEQRILDYCRPLAGLATTTDYDLPENYDQRIAACTDLPLSNRGKAYAQMLAELLQMNAALALSDLSKIILRDGNESYLNMYPDVMKHGDGDFSERGLLHYFNQGHTEDRLSVFDSLDIADFAALYENAKDHAKRKLLGLNRSDDHSFTSSMAPLIGLAGNTSSTEKNSISIS